VPSGNLILFAAEEFLGQRDDDARRRGRTFAGWHKTMPSPRQ
jgi:hypothetical protein